jgi:hypothetical protein
MRSFWCGMVVPFLFVAVLARPQQAISSQQLQSPPAAPQDPQGLAILTQAITAAGGIQALAVVQDFTATGMITYYWAGDEVRGVVTLRGRGPGQFRLDANLPKGLESWVVSNGVGVVTEGGENRPIEYANAVNLGSLTFPYAYLAAAIRDSSTSISYMGLEPRSGATALHVRLRKLLPLDMDPQGLTSKLTVRDFFIDPVTFQVVGSLDMLHPKYQPLVNRPHEMRFADYRSVEGILVPFSITEITIGQRTFVIQLEQIHFNTGLQDVDFTE